MGHSNSALALAFSPDGGGCRLPRGMTTRSGSGAAIAISLGSSHWLFVEVGHLVQNSQFNSFNYVAAFPLHTSSACSNASFSVRPSRAKNASSRSKRSSVFPKGGYKRAALGLGLKFGLRSAEADLDGCKY